MVDPRIYRGFLVVVAFTVIVFGFSLQNQPAGLGTTIAPGQFFTSVQTTMNSLKQFAERAPGSTDDSSLASTVATDLRNMGGFTVQKEAFEADTTAGRRMLENVVATRAGLGSGTIVVVSHRDALSSPGEADLYSTAVLLDLARALSGETLDRSVMLVSTSGQIGTAGATRVAQSLTGQQVDAVIVLGDLAGSTTSSPVVVPWSSTDSLAPPLLVNTLSGFVASEAGIHNSGSGLAGQVARLAFPFAITEQAPFAAHGLPAVLLSLSGDQPIGGPIALGPTSRTANLGTAVLQTVSALDHGPVVGAPRGYLALSGQLVPLWAVRLLVFVLILPVAAAAVDAVARTRRRGHTLTRWLAWVLTGAVPFVIGLGALLAARAAGLLSFTPTGAVGSEGVPRTGGDVAVMLVVLALVVLSFVFLRPLCLRMLAQQLPESGRRPESPAADAAAVALSVVLCLLTLVVWALNPFAALLLIPALHLWLWLAQPGARSRRWSIALLLLVGIAPGVLVLFYYANAYGLSPLALAWSLALMPGGPMPVLAAMCWSVALGCLASALIIGLRTVRATATAAEAPVTVRGPASYAGPGSLGGTKSALRR
jgi:hypothetical protein